MRQLLSPPLTCPNCGARLVFWAWRLECGECAAGLRIRGWYPHVAYTASLLVTLGVLSLTGIPLPSSPLTLLALPLFIVIMLVGMHWYPPELDIISTRTSVLRLGVRDPSSGVPRPAPVFEKPVSVGRPMFQLRRQPFSLEAAGVVILLAALGGVWVWKSVEPVVERVFPNFRAMREANRDFPVTIRIDGSSLAVTNGSQMPWSCDVSLGRNPRYRARVGVLPGGTSNVPYNEFRTGAGLVPGRDQTLRVIARDIVRVSCVEPDGRSRFWTFQ